jgi:hypothetical protein
MRNNPIRAIVVAIVAFIVFVMVVANARAMLGGAEPSPMPNNAAGPAQGGALATGGALETGGSPKPEAGYKSMPARDMPRTISSYPPPPSPAASEGTEAR